MNGLYESGEDYLETILILKKRNGNVRSIDIAREMDLSKPSVSRAMGILKNKEFITVDEDGAIHLTEEGSKLAKKIYERHRVLTEALMYLGVDEKTAAEDACRIEHDISEKTFTKIKKHLREAKKID
ncbi:MAG: metal-dependent transcriptional regulator [Clostridiales bacterium]|jgi:Mn-dependent DtxR family transcriptional regulator|nr:metal-dependent transcriptional regulator [Clostridiales bacterium]MBQ5968194.1 metal-dependent transcriptional regulator [Clostridiales bacterium]MBQ6271477.1 metal-dependent transcriptional regulator [Clostridiales bacterium]MCR5058384.1 metal-dependent transcriptional regulator [Clostridiales bacterium]